MADSMFVFNFCTEPGCESTSTFWFDNITALRLGYKFYVEHINELVIIEWLKTESMTSNTLFIYITLVSSMLFTFSARIVGSRSILLTTSNQSIVKFETGFTPTHLI